MRRSWVVVALLLALAGTTARAQEAPEDVWIHRGGEPGVRILIDGRDVGTADAVGRAISVDPSRVSNVSISISPPPGETWEVRGIHVGLLLNGLGSEPPAFLTRDLSTDSLLPSGYTVVVNRTLDLGAMKRLGSGAFLMQASVRDANGSELHAQSFFVRVEGPGIPLLTAQGAAVTAVSVATGYGLWRVAKDLKELRDVWDRHRKRRAEARRRLNLDVVGAAENAVEEALARAGKPAATAVAIRRAADDAERSLRPARWAATGLGLGGVAMAWLQFLGLLALDALGTLMTALEVAAAFLTLALVGNAMLRRARESARTRTLVPEAPGAASHAAAQAETPSER